MGPPQIVFYLDQWEITNTEAWDMSFARWVFRIAGIYGVVAMTPFFFMEEPIGRDDPPAITHPEFFYAFVGVALSWQVAFLVISTDPARYRLLMIPAVLEKASFGIAAPLLFVLGRCSAPVFAFSLVDIVLGVLFVISYYRCASETTAPNPIPAGEKVG
jgi:hypothetical protein